LRIADYSTEKFMGTKEQCDRYSTEMARRFEDFTKWAIENWPHTDMPLTSSDFSESRKEIGQILGPRLMEGRTDFPELPSDENSPRYVQTTPAPWP
jgi:hypothetical protein